jgi:hypothetical protein
MAGKDVSAFGAALTSDGTSDGSLTFAATANFRKGRTGWLKDNNSPSQKCLITEITSATVIKVKFVADQLAVPVGALQTGGETRQLGAFAPNYGTSDCSAYTVAQSARFDMEPGFVYDEPR